MTGCAKEIRSGHAGGHLRDALLEALEAFELGEGKSWVDAFKSPKEAKVLLGKLYHCTDVVPGATRAFVKDMLRHDKEPMTYAQLSRALLADMRITKS